MFAYVINDGGFSYGMDYVTAVSWRFTARKLSRRIYRSWLLPPYMVRWAKEHPTWTGSYAELMRIADGLRNS